MGSCKILLKSFQVAMGGGMEALMMVLLDFYLSACAA